MLTDRGPSPQLRADEIDVEWLRGSDVLHVSGYALLDGAIAEAGARAAGAAGPRAHRSASTSPPLAASPPSDLRSCRRLEHLEPDIVFAGERELEALGREPPPQRSS